MSKEIIEAVSRAFKRGNEIGRSHVMSSQDAVKAALEEEIELALAELNKPKQTSAEKFLNHMIRRCQKDGRLEWMICPLSESHGLMIQAYAEMRGMDVEKFRSDYNKTLQFTP